ncbi:MAG: ROK family protein [Chloroflexi bacterium]|nr:ROK family protein [Chloroflexota bacterium]
MSAQELAPAPAIEEAPSQPLALALDLGGTRFRWAIVDAGGRLRQRAEGATEQAITRPKLMARLEKVARNILADPAGRIVGLGAAVPGPMDPRRGYIYAAPNLPCLDDFDFKRYWEEHLGLSVWAANDADLAALGEQRFGAARGAQHLVYLTVSTGIGGGFVLDGHLYEGAGGPVAEVGHMVIDAHGPPCRCGRQGCLEALASGTAIARMAAEALAERPGWSPAGPGGNISGTVTAQQVALAARAGDAVAVDIFARAAGALATAILNLVHLLAPEILILGGGVMQAEDLLLPAIREQVIAGVLPGFRVPPILTAALGDNAGLIGAASLVFDHFRETER